MRGTCHSDIESWLDKIRNVYQPISEQYVDNGQGMCIKGGVIQLNNQLRT
jgi:hypothetical protein